MPKPKAHRVGEMMGTNGDSPNRSNLKGFNYQNGKWINRNGTQVGESDQEDSTIRPRKSTGDRPSNVTPLMKAARKKRLGKGGY